MCVRARCARTRHIYSLTLPRSINDSNILFIKLKKKLSFKSHVYSEAVRPDFIFQVLDYLKSVNPLYENVNLRPFFIQNANDDLEVDFIDDNQVDFVVADEKRSISLKCCREISNRIYCVSCL